MKLTEEYRGTRRATVSSLQLQHARASVTSASSVFALRGRRLDSLGTTQPQNKVAGAAVRDSMLIVTGGSERLQL